jgi:uncharacterized protein YcfL
MKKLFVLFVVAGLALTSCGSNAQQEEVTEPQADTTAVQASDSTACCPDSTAVKPVETVVQ